MRIWKLIAAATVGALLFVLLDYATHRLLLERIIRNYYPEGLPYFTQKAIVFLAGYTASRRIWQPRSVKAPVLGVAIAGMMMISYGVQTLVYSRPLLGVFGSSAIFVAHAFIAVACVAAADYIYRKL